MLSLYTDAACTSAVGASIPLFAAVDHSEGAQDLLLYLADIEADPSDTGTIEVVDQANPGVDNIIVSIADANPGTGQAPTDFKLASTLAGLDPAAEGAALSMGNNIVAGVSGAVEVHVRFENTRETVGISPDLSLDITATTAQAI